MQNLKYFSIPKELFTLPQTENRARKALVRTQSPMFDLENKITKAEGYLLSNKIWGFLERKQTQKTEEG